MFSLFKKVLLAAVFTPAMMAGAQELLESYDRHEEFGYGYYGKSFGFGSIATEEEIAGWDRDVRYDGEGAPEGQGSVEEGEPLYEAKCTICHGTFGEGEGRWPKLSGGVGTLMDQLTSRPEKTVGSYWPYAGTLLDYIWRAMPYTQPRSLSANEAYAVTAYVLYLNELVEEDFVLDKESIKSIEMPNVGNFIPDPRPDTKNTLCMTNCRNPEDMVLQEHIKGVTPTEHLRQRIADQLNAQDEEEVKPIVLSAAGDKGRSVYTGKCDVCHTNGVGGAPKIGVGEKEIWSKRSQSGFAALFKNVIEGYEGNNGVMPAKGGFVDLTDEEVQQAVTFMLESSGISP